MARFAANLTFLFTELPMLERFAAARPGDAFAAAQLEARAMRRAHQQAVLALEKLARGPIQSASGVRADVEPGAHGVAVAIQQQRLGVAVDARFGLGEAAVGQALQLDQRLTGRVGAARWI